MNRTMVVAAAMMMVVMYAPAAFGAGGSTPAIPVMPIFESYGNVSFDDGTGAGWWNFSQYDGRAQVGVGAYSAERIVRADKNMVVDKDNPSLFSFYISMQTLDNAAPTGKLNFSSYSSKDDNSISLYVHDGLQDVFVGWDYEKWEPIYEQQMRANFNANIYVSGWIDSVNDSLGQWTSSWYDGDGNLYFQQTGEQFTVYGNGRFADINVGLSMVASGMAEFGAIPEPATFALLGLGGLMTIYRRGRRI